MAPHHQFWIFGNNRPFFETCQAKGDWGEWTPTVDADRFPCHFLYSLYSFSFFPIFFIVIGGFFATFFAALQARYDLMRVVIRRFSETNISPLQVGCDKNWLKTNLPFMNTIIKGVPLNVIGPVTPDYATGVRPRLRLTSGKLQCRVR